MSLKQPSGNKQIRWADWSFHPLAVAAYAVWVLFVLNVEQVRPAVAVRSLGAALLLSLVLWGLFGMLMRDWRRGAILATIFLGLFFSYGHVYHYFEGHASLGLVLGRHRVLAVIYAGAALLAVWVVGWKLRDLIQATRFFNLMSLILLLFPLIQWAVFGLEQVRRDWNVADVQGLSQGTGLRVGESVPDVYYIVLDGYSRQDILAERFEFDNSAFVQALRELGFYVADCSQTNYTQTLLAMTSTLNMAYLDDVGEWKQTTDLFELVQQNAVRRIFAEMGYTTVAFETGYYWLNLEDVDVFYTAVERAVNPGEAQLRVNGFEAMLIRQSAGLVLTDLLAFLPGGLQPDLEYPNRAHAEQVLYAFEKLADIPLEVSSPKFVYAHIVSPHSPIVFGPEGEWVTLPADLDDAGWRKAHTDQIQYVNQRTLEVVSELITVSAREPVIILQGDHGAMISDQENHVEILNAYYLPGDGEMDLYATISPVNSFRVILNRYFGGEFPLLEDVTFRSYYEQQFEFEQIHAACPTHHEQPFSAP